MEPLRQDDPRRIGPYLVVAGLDGAAESRQVSERRFIARAPGGDRTVVVTVPMRELEADSGFIQRFRVEAEQAQRLGAAQPWLAPVVEISNENEQLPWRATPFVPALALPDAVAAQGGPLPERTVGAVGAALAEAITQLHGHGFAHAGISPWAVLITGEGPRLMSFGAVRAAGPDGDDRSSLPGLASESVAPEQLAGGRPRPLGDVYALGVELSYAATGHMTPERDELPASMRDLIAACLARDPAQRPQAPVALDELMRCVSLPSQSAMPGGVRPETVLDGGASRAASLLVPGWLPTRMSVALSTQAAAVLAAETEQQPDSVEQAAGLNAITAGVGLGAAANTVSDLSGGATGSNGTTMAPGGKLSAGGGSSRRTLITTTASGVAGLAMGGTVTWVATAEEVPPPTPAERLAARKKSHKRLEGAAPSPHWRYRIPGPAPRYPPVIHGGKVAVIAGESAVHGVSVRTGEQLWQQSEIGASGPPQIIDGGLVLVPGRDMVALNPRTGAVRWHSKKFRKGGSTPYIAVLAVRGSTVWFTVKNHRASAPEKSVTVVAYDVAERAELWRSPVPGEPSEGHLLKDVLLVTTPGASSISGKSSRQRRLFVALDRRTGTVRWRRTYEGVTSEQMLTTFSGGELVAADETRLRGYAVERIGGPRWSIKSKGKNDRERPSFGPPLVHGEVAYSTDASQTAHAIDAGGEVRWQSETLWGWETGQRLPDTLVTPSAQLVLSLNKGEVMARDGRGGEVLWRFLDVPDSRRLAEGWRKAAVTDEVAVVISRNRAYALPLG